jgi:hypothetical protein
MASICQTVMSKRKLPCLLYVKFSPADCFSSPARHVTGDWGKQVQKKFFNELLERLEKIQPGISSNI